MIPFGPAELAAAWLLDAALGDPPALARFHPVVLLGRVVSAFDRRWGGPGGSPLGAFLRGVALLLLIGGGAGLAAWGLVQLAARIDPWLARAVGIWLAWTALATRDLDRHVRVVVERVEAGDLPEARRRLSWIVGRDTENLPADEILRAAFETAAENTSDGIVGPAFYLILGAFLGLGPCLAMAYKGVSTLDSMVGYRDERYEFFGKASARADDLLNLLPARLTAWLAALFSPLVGGSPGRTARITLRDARRHASPNAGYPEAAFAGALGVRIGGVNYYGGERHEGTTFGNADRPLDAGRVRGALRLIWAISLGCLALGLWVLSLR